MKHLYTAILLLFLLPANTMAQSTLVEKYGFAPNEFQQVYLDMVKDNASEIITTTSGQYIGQVNSDHLLYGYGMFVNNDGSQIIGQFRNGKLLFGITMSADHANVGSPDYYTTYSLSTGSMEHVFRSNTEQVVDGKGLYDYAFVSMRYQNGDQYVGEIYKRQRHGFGLYYYANGDIWYGSYNKDVRSGFGCLFSKDNELTIGWWEGEDVVRSINVKEVKLKKRK